MDVVYDLQGRARASIEDPAEGAFRDARILCENFLRHMLIFHQLLDSVFHVCCHSALETVKYRYY